MPLFCPTQDKRGELENHLTGLTLPLFVPVSKEEGRVVNPFNWFNHASFFALLKTRGENWKTI
jgi:hypothetical protein